MDFPPDQSQTHECVFISVAFAGSQTSGESLKLEMAQEGFSAVYVPEVKKNTQEMPCTTPRFTYFIASSISFILKGIQMAIVGANEWKGGFLQYSSSGLKTGSYEADIETDSYLGKNVQTKQTPFACTANAFFSFLFAIKFYVIYYYGIKSIVLCFM